MIRILAVDPGKTTGVAVLQWSGDKEDDPVLESSAEVDEVGFPEYVLDAFDKDIDYVVCESFTITTQTGKNSQAPYSLEAIGVLKYLCRKRNYPPEDIVFQSPANAKSMFPNPTLSKVGLWHRGGRGHALDAIRHGALRAVKAGWIPRKIL